MQIITLAFRVQRLFTEDSELGTGSESANNLLLPASMTSPPWLQPQIHHRLLRLDGFIPKDLFYLFGLWDSSLKTSNVIVKIFPETLINTAIHSYRYTDKGNGLKKTALAFV